MDRLLIANRDAILGIAHKHGVRRVRVFGSFARGEARPDSDIDLLVDAIDEVPPWFPGGLVAELETLLGRRVDIVEVSALNPRMKEAVLREAAVL